ncbi:DUF5677 domain-containing protein [Rhizobium sp. 1AS11]|uniref:DUF5677 domain-containing protein n=1 Tax=Rhizobium acaciae TaxID=2989736 RepID=UPI0022224A7E|nr:DUF5677 domain-containing protein [Rhizobium acaciae]MCW1410185.1 DUF5677 domain-containing protein [Rhizobium acaciae]MCW1742533.1 DUF5677 domain-containing protein [Rhizobium acaciae]
MLEFLDELVKATIKLLPSVKFDKSHPVHRLLMALYSTIIEDADSAVTLLGMDRWAGVEHLLRSALEAHVDLINLASDPQYLDLMMIAYHKQWIRLTEAGAKGDNQFLTFFKDNPEVEEQLAYHKEELAKLGTKGPALNIFERFEKAGMSDIYRSIYHSLCNDTHNNVQALTDRHFRVSKAEGLINLVIFEDPEQHSLKASLDCFIATVNGSNKIIHHYFNTDAQNAVEEFHKRREEKGLIWADASQ